MSYHHHEDYHNRHEAASQSAESATPPVMPAFIEKLRILGANRSMLDRLVYMRDTGADEELKSTIKSLVVEAMKSDEEFIALRGELEEIRNRGFKTEAHETREQEIADRIRQIRLEYESAIHEMIGVTNESKDAQLEQARENAQELMRGEGTTVEKLGRLGLLSSAEDGEEVFTYPSGLFPPIVDAEMATYLQLVEDHMAISSRFVNGGGNVPYQQVEQADLARKIAHDKVSESVRRILFPGMPRDMGFREARSLVAKLRDGKVPNSGEKEIIGAGLKAEVAPTRQANVDKLLATQPIDIIPPKQ